MFRDPHKKTTSPISTYLWYLLIAALLGGSAVLLLPVYRDLLKQRNVEQETAETLRRNKEELAEIKNENQKLTTPAGVEKVARERFRMVKKGETVLVYEK